MERERGVYRVFVGKSVGKKPLGRPMRRWEDNIKMGLRELGCGSMDWIELAEVAGTCECGNELSVSINCGELLD
jgi:hypothetical protein